MLLTEQVTLQRNPYSINSIQIDLFHGPLTIIRPSGVFNIAHYDKTDS